MLFINLFLPYITNSNIIPGASQIIVTFVFGMLFMQGSAFFTLFVATLSNIGLIVINVSVMTAFSYFTQWDLNELIVNQLTRHQPVYCYYLLQNFCIFYIPG